MVFEEGGETISGDDTVGDGESGEEGEIKAGKEIVPFVVVINVAES